VPISVVVVMVCTLVMSRGLLPSLTLIIVDIKYRLFFLHRSSHN
jgi:hypothetical protein